LDSDRAALARPRRLLVDGDNLIGHWGGPRPGDDRREEVVRRVSALCARLEAEAVVVFDPGRAVPAAARVVVRLAEDDADTVIRALVDAEAEPAELTVVTSDKPLYSYARTRGARVLRAHEWGALERTT
jgi:predicted RNA-binding protein with PIN domain